MNASRLSGTEAVSEHGFDSALLTALELRHLGIQDHVGPNELLEHIDLIPGILLDLDAGRSGCHWRDWVDVSGDQDRGEPVEQLIVPLRTLVAADYVAGMTERELMKTSRRIQGIAQD